MTLVLVRKGIHTTVINSSDARAIYRANPFLTLFEDDSAVAFASCWRVDWSERGQGRVVVFETEAGVRVVATDADLGSWMANTFNPNLKASLSGLQWSPPEIVEAPVEFEMDLDRGFRASVADIEVTIAEPIDRHLTRDDAYDLGGSPNVLSTVWVPCRTGIVSVGGERVAGMLRIDEAAGYASAAIAEAEVWCHPE